MARRVLRIVQIPLFASTMMILVRIAFWIFGVRPTETPGLLLMGLGLAAVLIEGFRWTNYWMDRRVNWKEYPVKRFVVQLSIHIGIILFFCVGVKLALLKYVFKADLRSIYQEELIINLVIFLVGLIVTLSILGVTLVRRWASSQAELEISRRKAIEYHYETLVNQINPHFLFNSLNTLRSLIYTDQNKAAEFTQDLSRYFRNILGHQRQQMISVREELELACAYINLLKLRFGDQIHVAVGKEMPSSEKKVPTFTIQLLIENAVNHNHLSDDHPLMIDIFEDRGWLVVRNAIHRRKEQILSTGIGLQNLQSRYLVRTGKEAVITEDNDQFSIRLPLI